MPKIVEFANMFQSSVEEGITNTLGRSVMQTVQNLVSQSFKAYAERPADLHRELSKIFGSACETLEKMIAKELFQRLNLHYSSELDFDTCIQLARSDTIQSGRGNN